MTEEDYDRFIEKKWAKAHLLDPYRDFIVRYLQQYPDTPAAVMHDKLKEQFATLPKVDPKTVYSLLIPVDGMGPGSFRGLPVELLQIY